MMTWCYSCPQRLPVAKLHASIGRGTFRFLIARCRDSKQSDGRKGRANVMLRATYGPKRTDDKPYSLPTRQRAQVHMMGSAGWQYREVAALAQEMCRPETGLSQAWSPVQRAKRGGVNGTRRNTTAELDPGRR